MLFGQSSIRNVNAAFTSYPSQCTHDVACTPVDLVAPYCITSMKKMTESYTDSPKNCNKKTTPEDCLCGCLVSGTTLECKKPLGNPPDEVAGSAYCNTDTRHWKIYKLPYGCDIEPKSKICECGCNPTTKDCYVLGTGTCTPVCNSANCNGCGCKSDNSGCNEAPTCTTPKTYLDTVSCTCKCPTSSDDQTDCAEGETFNASTCTCETTTDECGYYTLIRNSSNDRTGSPDLTVFHAYLTHLASIGLNGGTNIITNDRGCNGWDANCAARVVQNNDGTFIIANVRETQGAYGVTVYVNDTVLTLTEAEYGAWNYLVQHAGGFGAMGNTTNATYYFDPDGNVLNEAQISGLALCGSMTTQSPISLVFKENPLTPLAGGTPERGERNITNFAVKPNPLTP